MTRLATVNSTTFAKQLNDDTNLNPIKEYRSRSPCKFGMKLVQRRKVDRHQIRIIDRSTLQH